MIKLTLPPKPEKLIENEAALTAEFKADNKKSVWHKDYIINPLLEMTCNKCAYSEVRLNEESKYMEVEHFKHKNSYPDDVVKWGNLLPSCKTCNDTKGTWDVVADPIVNPIVDTPRDHLYINACRFGYKDEKGKNTIDAVALNDTDNIMVPRFRVVCYTMDNIKDRFDLLKAASTLKEVNIRLRKLKNSIAQCGPEYPYSAACATHLLYEWDEFPIIRDYLENKGLWDDDFRQLISKLESIALPKM